MKELVNRFPVCGFYYYAVAKRLGFQEEEAKSLGLGRAVFFAWAKKRGWTRRWSSQGGQRSTIEERAGQLDQAARTVSPQTVRFAGMDTPILRLPDGQVRYALGGEVQTPEQFDRQVLGRLESGLGPDRLQRLRKFLENLLATATEDELNSGQAYRIYETIRDTVRREEFYERNEAIELEPSPAF